MSLSYTRHERSIEYLRDIDAILASEPSEAEVDEVFLRYLDIELSRLRRALLQNVQSDQQSAVVFLSRIYEIIFDRCKFSTETLYSDVIPEFLKLVLEAINNIFLFTKKEIFSHCTEYDYAIELSSLDLLQSQCEYLIRMGEKLPMIDFEIMRPFGDLLCDLMKYFLNYLTAEFYKYEKQDNITDTMAFERLNFLEHIRSHSYRLQSLTRWFLDCICLVDLIKLPVGLSDAKINVMMEKDSLYPVKIEGIDDVVFYITSKLMSDSEVLRRFLHSRVNTLSSISEECLIAVKREMFKDLPADTSLNWSNQIVCKFRLVASQVPDDALAVVTKSMVKRRRKDNSLAVNLFDGGEFEKITSTNSCEKETFFAFDCFRRMLNEYRVLNCIYIAKFLMVLKYTERRLSDEMGTRERQDKGVAASLFYILQVILETTEPTNELQQTYESLVERAGFWIEFNLTNYAQNIDRNWASYYLMKHIEFLTLLLRKKEFSHLTSWDSIFESIETALAKVEALPISSVEPTIHTFILNQGRVLRNAIHNESGTELNIVPDFDFPDKEVLRKQGYKVLDVLMTSPNIIYRCIDNLSFQLVAIKRLKKDDSANEIHFQKSLTNHPNIIKLIDVFKNDAFSFIVMEFCENSIEFSGDQQQGLPDLECRRICRQILNGLSYIHGNHIIHRDIKPSNILGTAGTFIKIIDFGEAILQQESALEHASNMEKLGGTIVYLAPECARNEALTTAVDIWSFGCVMAYLMTGISPWKDADNQYNVLYRLGSTQQIPFDLEAIDISSEAKEILTQTFSHDPEVRPTASQLLGLEYFRNIPDSII